MTSTSAREKTASRRSYGRHLKLLDRVLGPWSTNGRLNAQALIELAQNKSGIQFASTDFRRPLQCWLDAMQKLSLTNIGRLVLRQTALHALQNRLYIQRASATKTPADIRDPIFIIGLQRTGTTFMHTLLAQHPHLRALRLWELMAPAQQLPSARLKAAAKRTTFFNRLLIPEMDAVHRMRYDSPEECWWLFANSFGVMGYHLHFELPGYAQRVLQGSMVEHYRYYKLQLQLLAQQDDPQLVLKCPDHLWKLEDLLQVFPQARLIWTHRHPQQALSSYCSLTALHRRTMLGSYEAQRIGRHILESFAQGIDHATKVCSTLPATQVIHIDYNAFVARPLETIGTICAQCDLPFAAQNKRLLQNHLAQERHSFSHRHSLEQFDLTQREVHEKFADYLQFMKRFER